MSIEPTQTEEQDRPRFPPYIPPKTKKVIEPLTMEELEEGYPIDC